MIGRRGFITGLVLLVLVGAAHGQDSGTGLLTVPSTPNISVSMPKSCWIASIADKDKAVTIDWDCVGEFAKRYRAGEVRHGYNDAIAHVLQAFKDGEAKSK